MALTDNLVSYWKLDGNSNDSKGSNNGADTAISYSVANGKIIQGAGFNGTSSLITITQSASINLDTPFSYNVWLKTTQVTTGDLMFKIATNGYSMGIYNVDQKLFFYAASGAANELVSGGGAAVNDGIFHMATFVSESATSRKIYLDGSLVKTGVVNIAGSLSSTANMLIGSNGTGEYWNGAIDEPGWWSRALNASEVSSLYAGGSGISYPFSSGIILSNDLI